MAPHHAPEVHTALRMVPLFERGREALRVYVLTLRPVDRPVGGAELDVVTHADFIAEPALCLRHCTHNGSPIHILCPNGSLCALIEKLHPHF